ncbi:MAG: hypothetical protein QOE92_914 [Chloroflexota bacterium]|jgi:hypothetical protein|nr:hypothetical protein [Chloroflexota bacterium]
MVRLKPWAGYGSSDLTRKLLFLTLLAAMVVTLVPVGASAGLIAPKGTGPLAAWVPPPSDSWQGHGVDPKNPQACDPIDPAQCMLPYPNDWFTKADPSSATGRRLDLVIEGMPRNQYGKPIEPTEWNRSDGFSAGAQVLTYVPGMTSNDDLVPSGLPPITNLGANANSDLGAVILDTQTGARVPLWAEVDQYTDQAGLKDGGSVQRDLMIHPAINLADGHRYIVALRHLHLDSGAIAQPSAAFRAYRDGTAKAADPRRAHMESIFQTLGQAGVGRGDLYLAWDFTTASTDNVTGRLTSIRDDAFRQLGDSNLADGAVSGAAPAFVVDSVTNYTPAQNSRLARQVQGHFTVPCYIAPTCDPPVKCDGLSQGIVNDCPSTGQFALNPADPDSKPIGNPARTYQANFICNASRGGFESHTKMRPVEYGHGLFGDAGEVNSGPQQDMTSRFGMMYCATDWFGMATADLPNAVIALSDLSRFAGLTDRVQQGELDFLYLARLFVHPQGFSSNAAFQWSDGQSFIDTTEAYYDGNSQGGIYGGTVCAVSVDVHRCVLGVPGMNYSMLLPRSSDYVASQPLSAFNPLAFDPGDPTAQVGYSQLLDTFYPHQPQRMLLLDLIQTLWDRSDPNGYASHMTGGLPNTPGHHVLLQVAYGDHQVANITAETEARTIGAAGLYQPLVSARYGAYQDPFWGIPAINTFPYDGSAINLFDTGPVRGAPDDGTNPPPTADLPNRSGKDPHEAPRRAPWGQVQKSDFLSPGGRVTNPQPGGAPYFAWGWDGVSGL